MIEDFITAELLLWALMIALLPVAAAVGLALIKFQADNEVRERLRSGPPIATGKPRVLPNRDRPRRIRGSEGSPTRLKAADRAA